MVAPSQKFRCREKAISITYTECVFVALGTQTAKRTRRIVIYGLSGSKIFSMLFHIRKEFREKTLLNIKCVLNFSTNFVCNISQSKRNSERYYHKRA
jgi:hypothetical protein